LTGIPAAPGLAHGMTVIVKKAALEIPQYSVGNEDVEVERLMQACHESQAELLGLKENVGSRPGKDEAEIFEAHRNPGDQTGHGSPPESRL